MHTSVAVPGTMEFLEITRINPLISKCKIKVCYVGDTPNRNRSIITEEVAREIAQSLPGSPIVGYFNETKGDFEEHNDIFHIKNGEVIATTNTRPYGFVDLNAKVWFEQYLDDNTDYRKYLVTEGYIWTGQYPESKKVFEDEGNPHSLEFDENNGTLDAFWTKDYNGKKQFFIINEAVISKLCILGEDIEPCFEGSSITHFTLQEDFKQTLFKLTNEMKHILEGGTTMSEEIKNTQQVEEVVKEPTTPTENSVVEEPVNDTSATVVEEPAADSASTEFKKKNDGEEEDQDDKDPDNKGDNEDEDDKKKKAKYDLNDIVEYVELQNSYNTLQTSYSVLEEEVASLRQFKASAEKKEKEALIKSFSMLSDEDKQDVVDNIDKYSYMDIKSKLSVICVDKKVSFAVENEAEKAPVTYNLSGEQTSSASSMPAWLQQVEKYNK